MRFSKYHALGNDYLVLEPKDASLPGTADTVRICHRNFGLGSDGILFGPLASTRADFGLRILNPDGSEAEKSGNGLRIFACHLADTGRVREEVPFTIEVPGGVVRCVVAGGGSRITVEMGRVSFRSDVVPVLLPGPAREVLDEAIEVGGESLRFSAATIGNPHCVVFARGADEALARRLGPLLEHHPFFPRRTNVQFAEVIDRRTLRIEIWERGAGYTLASGSSSSAAAAVAARLGLVDHDLTVVMPGGTLGIAMTPGFDVTMTGPATRVATMDLDPAALR